MAVRLLDVNALVALLWPAHVHHEAAQEWFRRHSRAGWATTPFTQAGFVRIVSNPAFSPDAVSPEEAVALLKTIVRHHTHRFWPADLEVSEALGRFGARLVGHRQITDAYLLRLALAHKGKLATFDSGLLALCAESDPAREAIELIATDPRKR